MKKILITLVLALAASTASAHGNYSNRNNWVAPFVVGASVGYLVTRPYYNPPPVYYPPQVVYVQTPVYYQQPNPAPSGYHYENILDANCNCYKIVLVPN